MTIEIAIVLAVILIALVLFFTEVIAVELTAVIVMGILILSKVITPEEGISGFSNPATVTVGAMFVLSAGLFRTGALNFVGDFLFRAHYKSQWLFLFLLTFMAGAMSAFINDTAVVALLIPIVMKVSKRTKISPSLLLMPLSFSALFGGVCTLIGTSTNILVSSIAEKRGIAPFSMFEMAPFGIVIFITGVIYMVFAAKYLIPDRGLQSELVEEFGMGEYMTDIVVLDDSRSIGTEIGNSPLVKELDIDIIHIHKKKTGMKIYFPPTSTVIEEGDILRVRGNPAKISELQQRAGIKLKSDKKLHDSDISNAHTKLVEAIISPTSQLISSTIKEIDFRSRYNATVLAIRHREKLVNERLGHIHLSAGDVLLIDTSPEVLKRLQKSQDFVIVSDVGLEEFRRNKIFIAFGIILGVVIAAATGILPILTGSIIGCILMIVTKCIKLDECYKAVEWKVIFLLAGVLSMGVALERSGAALLISNLMVETVGQFGNRALISAFFLLTLLFTNFMSNNATAALLAPIAIITAQSLGLSPRPFLMTVAFAASLSLITPVGYQTNTMIYVPGKYRFFDFMKVGLPLDIIFWILATILIPIMYPF